MAIPCTNCGSNVFTCGCKPTRSEAPMPKPLALTEDQIKALERRAIQNWPIHRGDMEALFAMARERNALIASRPKDIPQQPLAMMGHPWGSP